MGGTTSEKELRGATSSSGEVAHLDLRRCSSSPTAELSLKSGRGTTMIGTTNIGQCLMPHARDRSGTRVTTWVQATAHPTRASLDVDMATVLETLSALAAKISLSIFFLKESMVKDFFGNESYLFIFSLKESLAKDL